MFDMVNMYRKREISLNLRGIDVIKAAVQIRT